MSEEPITKSTMVSIDLACDVLKEHFPEYLSGYCLCGSPIGTYMMWIDHYREVLGATSPDGQTESSEDDARDV